MCDQCPSQEVPERELNRVAKQAAADGMLRSAGLKQSVTREKAAIETEVSIARELREIVSQEFSALVDKIAPILAEETPTEESQADRAWEGTSSLYENLRRGNNDLNDTIRWIRRVQNRVEL